MDNHNDHILVLADERYLPYWNPSRFSILESDILKSQNIQIIEYSDRLLEADTVFDDIALVFVVVPIEVHILYVPYFADRSKSSGNGKF